MTAFAFARAVDILEESTKEFWRISNIVTGRSKGKLTAGEAIDQVNSLESKLGPHRALTRSAKGLSNVIIEGKRIKKKQPASVTALANSGVK